MRPIEKYPMINEAPRLNSEQLPNLSGHISGNWLGLTNVGTKKKRVISLGKN